MIRCGRTARIGNTGSAVVFLTPEEESFVEFIEINQKVPLHKMDKLEIDHNCIPEGIVFIKIFDASKIGKHINFNKNL